MKSGVHGTVRTTPPTTTPATHTAHSTIPSSFSLSHLNVVSLSLTNFIQPPSTSKYNNHSHSHTEPNCSTLAPAAMRSRRQPSWPPLLAHMVAVWPKIYTNTHQNKHQKHPVTTKYTRTNIHTQMHGRKKRGILAIRSSAKEGDCVESEQREKERQGKVSLNNESRRRQRVGKGAASSL